MYIETKTNEEYHPNGEPTKYNLNIETDSRLISIIYRELSDKFKCPNFYDEFQQGIIEIKISSEDITTSFRKKIY